MKTAILALAIAVATIVVAVGSPADAGYIAPDAPWTVKAFCVRGC